VLEVRGRTLSSAVARFDVSGGNLSTRWNFEVVAADVCPGCTHFVNTAKVGLAFEIPTPLTYEQRDPGVSSRRSNPQRFQPLARSHVLGARFVHGSGSRT
jgi:hypothetical protein